MTCIAGIAHEGKVYMGADSAASNGDDLTIRSDTKIITHPGLVMGFTSSYRMGQLLRHAFHPPTTTRTELERYMCTDFVDSIRDCFKRGGYATKHSEAETGGTFLVGIDGRLFKIDCDYQVGETLCGNDAVGCGQSVALGSLFTSRRSRANPERRLAWALSASSRHSAGVRPPFVFAYV